MGDTALDRLFSLALTQLDDEAIRLQLKRIEDGTDEIELPDLLLVEDEEEEEQKNLDNLAVAIRGMTIPQRIKLALQGNKTARALLVRDTNKQIPLFVLENPRISENEVSEFARNSNLDDSVLRGISQQSQWMKTYSIKLNLISNPKCPIDISLRWLKFIKDRDLRRLAKSKDVPQVICQQSQKLLEKRGR